MPDILIRNMNADAVKRLKARARRHGRSLQGEVKTVLEQAAGCDAGEIAEILAGWQKKFAGRKFTSSVDLLREDRDR